MLGDSNSMGIQDAGLVQGSQLHSYPYLLARQMGRASLYQQPLVRGPGIGVPPMAEPMTLEGGALRVTLLPDPVDFNALLLTILQRLANRELDRPSTTWP